MSMTSDPGHKYPLFLLWSMIFSYCIGKPIIFVALLVMMMMT